MAIPDSIGVSFAPTREASELAPRRARTEGLQEAIRVLSLHVPQVLGGRPVAAGELLRASGGGDPVSAVVESVLRSVMGGQAAVGPTLGAAGGPSAPGATRAVGTAPAAPDTSAMLAQAVSTLARNRALPRFTVGPGIGRTAGEEAISQSLRPESSIGQLAAQGDPFGTATMAARQESFARMGRIEDIIRQIVERFNPPDPLFPTEAFTGTRAQGG